MRPFFLGFCDHHGLGDFREFILCDIFSWFDEFYQQMAIVAR